MVNFLRVVHLGLTTLLLGAVAFAIPLSEAPEVGDVVHYNSQPHVTVGHDHKGDALLVPVRQGKSYVGGPSSSIKPVVAHASELSSADRLTSREINQQGGGRSRAAKELQQTHRDASRDHSDAQLTHLSAQREHEQAAHHFAQHGDRTSASLHRAKADEHGRKAQYHGTKSTFHRNAAARSHAATPGALARARLSSASARLSKLRANRSISHAGAAKAHLDAADEHDRAALAHHRVGSYAMANLHAQHADSHRLHASMHAPGSQSLPDPTMSKEHAEASHRMASSSRESAITRGQHF